MLDPEKNNRLQRIGPPVGWERKKFGLLVPGVRVRKPKLPFLPGLIPLPDGSGWTRVPLEAAIAHVQTASDAPGTVSSDTLVYGSNVTAGSLLVGVFRCGSAGDPITVEDDLNGAWTQAGKHTQTNDGNAVIYIFYRANSAAGACTVTATLTASAIFRWIISEFSGAATSSPLDGATVSAEGDSTDLASGAKTPSADGALFICGGANTGGATYTAGTDFTIPTNGVQAPGAGSQRVVLEYFIQSTAASHDGTITQSVSQGWAAILAVFKAPAAGGAASPVIGRRIFVLP